MRRFPVLILVSIFALIGSDCREREKPSSRRRGADGGVVALRAECDEPSYKCHMSCIKRDASPACTRCCMDQRYVCDDGHKADFESCEGSR